MNNPDQTPSRQAPQPDAESATGNMPLIPGSPTLDALAQTITNPETLAFISSIKRASAIAQLSPDREELIKLNDALVFAARDWIVSQGYNTPHVLQFEDRPEEMHQVLVLGTGENDYLSEAARDCAGRGQRAVYHPVKQLEDIDTIASFSKDIGWFSISHQILITAQLDDVWPHERAHGIINYFRETGIDHLLHGTFTSGQRSPLHQLPYGNCCGFDELLAYKEGLSHLVSQIESVPAQLDTDLLTSIIKTTYHGSAVSKIISEGVVALVPAQLDALSALKESPNAFLTTLSKRGNEARFVLGEVIYGCVNSPKIDLWDGGTYLHVKVSDRDMHSEISFDLVEPKWLMLQRELRGETMEKNLTISQVLDHPHFTAINDEIRRRCTELKELVSQCWEDYVDIHKLALSLRKATVAQKSPVECMKDILELKVIMKFFDQTIPCPESPQAKS